MLWILDDGPFQILARVLSERELEAWPAGEIAIADATARAAALDKTGRRQGLLAARSGEGAQIVQIIQVTVNSPAGEVLYQHLRAASRGTADLAEHESIAWAIAVDPNAVFVAKDKLAAYLALAELGRGRVCHPFELWRHLLERRMIAPDQYTALNQATARSDPSLPGVPWRWRTL